MGNNNLLIIFIVIILILTLASVGLLIKNKSSLSGEIISSDVIVFTGNVIAQGNECNSSINEDDGEGSDGNIRDGYNSVCEDRDKRYCKKGYCGECYENNDCNSGETCDNQGNCGSDGGNCIPQTCPSYGYQCGTWLDGCEGQINCGECSQGQICNDGVCITSSSCNAWLNCLGRECGSDGCGGVCGGGCDEGSSCNNEGVCVVGSGNNLICTLGATKCIKDKDVTTEDKTDFKICVKVGLFNRWKKDNCEDGKICSQGECILKDDELKGCYPDSKTCNLDTSNEDFKILCKKNKNYYFKNIKCNEDEVCKQEPNFPASCVQKDEANCKAGDGSGECEVLLPEGYKECKDNEDAPSAYCKVDAECGSAGNGRLSLLPDVNFCDETSVSCKSPNVLCPQKEDAKGNICCPEGAGCSVSSLGVPYCTKNDGCKKGDEKYCAKDLCCNENEECKVSYGAAVCQPKDENSCGTNENFCLGIPGSQGEERKRCCSKGTCLHMPNGYPYCYSS